VEGRILDMGHSELFSKTIQAPPFLRPKPAPPTPQESHPNKLNIFPPRYALYQFPPALDLCGGDAPRFTWLDLVQTVAAVAAFARDGEVLLVLVLVDELRSGHGAILRVWPDGWDD